MQAALQARPLLFGCFTSSPEGDSFPGVYDEVPSSEALRKVLEARLDDHNEANPGAAMQLVLFDQAAQQVCDIFLGC